MHYHVRTINKIPKSILDAAPRYSYAINEFEVAQRKAKLIGADETLVVDVVPCTHDCE